MILDRSRGTIEHGRLTELPRHLGRGDLLVVNTSRTLPAAVAARRVSGAPLQLRPCVRRPGVWDVLAVEAAPPFGNVPLFVGETLLVGEVGATVLGPREDIPLLWRIRIDTDDDLPLILSQGAPIRYSYVAEPLPLRFSQTVYASHPGSAEAPSAGRPLSWELLRALAANGVGRAEIVLHTGLSSYQDDDFDAEHHLYEERFLIAPETVAAVARARRVIAVGTTVVRSLETVATGAHRIETADGWTTLRIGPETELRAVDGLLTGWHEPQASHFDLLRAFVPEPLLRRAYLEAIGHGYLWHEFGDELLIL
jgi:S-adenosylmethionine:tRNA ribosyltransferase-isomerase